MVMMWFMLCMVIWLTQSIYLFGGIQKPPTGSDKTLFNRQMRSVQITVALGLEDVVEKWKFLDFHSAMNIFEMPVAEFYTNGAFLTHDMIECGMMCQ